MDIKQIQELIKFVARSGVDEVSIEQESFKITIKTNQVKQVVPQQVIMPAAPMVDLPTQMPVAAPAPGAVAEAPLASQESVAANGNYITIKSPMIGTFYRASGPDKAPFVNVGDEITAGKTICIVEAMKLFNEIESEVSGRIVKVLTDDASPVEYDQPLFLVEPA